jgi:hypothetical protein
MDHLVYPWSVVRGPCADGRRSRAGDPLRLQDREGRSRQRTTGERPASAIVHQPEPEHRGQAVGGITPGAAAGACVTEPRVARMREQGMPSRVGASCAVATVEFESLTEWRPLCSPQWACLVRRRHPPP